MRNIENWFRQIWIILPTWMKDLLKVLYRIGNQSLVIFVLVMIPTLPMIWFLTNPIPTHIQIDLSVNKFSFRVAGNEPIAIKGIKFQSAIIEQFEKIQFLQNGDSIEITNSTSRVTIETISPNIKQSGILDTLVLTPNSEVMLNITCGEDGNKELIIFVENFKVFKEIKTPIAKFSHNGSFNLIRDNLISSSQLFNSTDFSEINPFIEITGQSQGLQLMLTIANDKNFDILPMGVKVTALDLVERDMVDGNVVVRTGLISKGKINYPAYPQIDPIEFSDSNFLILGKKDNFKVEHVHFDSESQSFKVRLSGLAQEQIATHPTGFPDKSRDYRLTRFETFAEKSKFRKLLLEIIIWLIPAIIGVVGIVIVGKVKIATTSQNE